MALLGEQHGLIELYVFFAKGPGNVKGVYAGAKSK